MSSLASPRGPLPPRVYWVRRGVALAVLALAVLALAVLLLVGLFRLVFGGSDDPATAQGTAQQAAGKPTATPAQPKVPTPTQATAVEPTPAASAEPNGRCTPADITISPRVNDAVAGTTVPITLSVHTKKAAACVWKFAPSDVMLKVSRGEAAIWTSAACPRWITAQTVVLRAASTTELEVEWNGRRSDTGCEERLSDYAEAGTYQVSATPMGGEAETTEFGLRRPTAADVTPASPTTAPTTPTTPPTTPTGKNTTGPSTGGNPGGQKPSGKPSTPTSQTVDPSSRPSGAVEPD